MTLIDKPNHGNELIGQSEVLQSAQNKSSDVDEYDKLESQMTDKLKDLQAEYEALELEAQRLR